MSNEMITLRNQLLVLASVVDAVVVGDENDRDDYDHDTDSNNDNPDDDNGD